MYHQAEYSSQTVDRNSLMAELSGGQDQVLPVCVLTDSEFEDICQHSRNGHVEEITKIVHRILTTRKCTVGPNTFCPDPLDQKPSPLVLAAQYGRKEVIDYFLEKFGDVIDVNHAATIVSRTTAKKVHCATALWAASTGGYLEIVKMLINLGAEVNKATLTQSTPLRGASFHGHIDVMDFLLDNGAEIDTPNCIGQSPLCIAAMRGQLPAVKYLVDKGANRHQKTINGYSVMHLSATKGRVDIVQFLLSIGIDPQFQEAKSSQDGYIPCPLFLAASTGQRRMVDMLLCHQDCPPSCKVDAILLLGSTRCEISARGLTMGSRDLWVKALEIREKNNIQVEFLPAIDSYGDRVEITDLESLNKLSAEPNFNRYEAYFQSLMIRERCMGYGDQGLIYFLIKRGMWFCNLEMYRECELLWSRAMEMEIKVCEMEIGHARYGHSEGLQRDLEKDLSQYAYGIWHMVHDNYRPDFRRYVEFGFKELDILSSLKFKSDNALFIDTESIVSVLLYIMASWLHYDNEISLEVFPEDSFCSPECDKLGTLFVTKCLRSFKGTTLLHHALSDVQILEQDKQVPLYEKYMNLVPLINALLHWGAYEVIDEPNVDGLRPIHVAVKTGNDLKEEAVQEVASPLISAGAHIDAVCKSGDTVFSLCESDVVSVLLNSSGPLSLACQCSNVIVRGNLNYQTLPARIVKWVKLHDRSSFG